MTADLRCEWGLQGARALAADCDVVVVVDVLSFSTCVDVALARGVEILPYRWKDRSSYDHARWVGAELARSRGKGRFSLSPQSFFDAPAGIRVVLPSPNGAGLTLDCGARTILNACLRNASAVAAAARNLGRRIAVVPAGERFADGSLRPCFEDWIGAGAVLAGLEGTASPEAEAAVAAFRQARDHLPDALRACASGRELCDRGWPGDVEIAAQLDVSTCVPLFQPPAYTPFAP
ncbi:MAG TPA: 2-phosphosulfolactate phosphatase [Planctomycetota bacterium]|nr:2-phosphosulfolactate phosphatase [Planctomycetota bacterium]